VFCTANANGTLQRGWRRATDARLNRADQRVLIACHKPGKSGNGAQVQRSFAMDEALRQRLLIDVQYALRQLRKFDDVGRALDALERVEDQLNLLDPTWEDRYELAPEPN
jgi:hypothetical protein